MDRKLMMLNMLKRSSNPGEVISGSDSIRRLQTLSAGKALIISGLSSQSSGALDLAIDLLDKGGNNPSSCILASGEPTISVVQTIVQQMQKVSPQWIIALGGGSVIDATKIAWACYEHPELDFTQPPSPIVPPLRQRAQLIAIPTTAGSGAEGSQAAVLKGETDNSVHPFVSVEWIPDIVILDPKLTLTLPPTLTALTGMDALSHAVESYVSRLSGNFLKITSATATRLILENLPTAYHQPENLLARENMLYGSYLAGLAQSSASTGLAHALTHASSAIIGASHSAGNALFLYPAMCLNRQKNETPYASLAKASGYNSLNALFSSIEMLAEEIALPQTLAAISQVPVSQTQCSMIAQKALTDVCIRTNPQKPQEEELLSLLGKLL